MLLFYCITEISNPVGIYQLKVNNWNTRTRYEICSKLTIKTRSRSGVFIINFLHISHLVLVLLLLTLNMQLPAGVWYCRCTKYIWFKNKRTIYSDSKRSCFLLFWFFLPLLLFVSSTKPLTDKTIGRNHISYNFSIFSGS